MVTTNYAKKKVNCMKHSEQISWHGTLSSKITSTCIFEQRINATWETNSLSKYLIGYGRQTHPPS